MRQPLWDDLKFMVQTIRKDRMNLDGHKRHTMIITKAGKH